MIPKGICQCGCGQRTKISPKTCTSKGWIKGEYRNFIHGHCLKGKLHPAWKNGKRISKQKIYIYISSKNYIAEHKLVVEKILGKSLTKGAIIHHVNGNPHDNKNENLVVCQDHAYHRLLHERQKSLRACGHANWKKCRYCKKYDDPKNLLIYTIKPSKANERMSAVHSKCSAEYQRKNRLRIKNERKI